jgi:uncharacterized SAM-binding protein YcdF (DUF218 family)
MFFYLSKLFGYLLSPALWLLLLIAWPLFARKPQKRRFRLILSLILAYLLMNPFLADEAMRLWEVPMKELPTEPRSIQAAVLLGGHMVSWDKAHHRYIFRQHTDRFLQTYALYSSGKVARIIISAGPGHPIRSSEREAAYLSDYLKDVGVNAKDIFIDTLSRNTRENALRTKDLMASNSISGPVVLVTSAAHMRRAAGCFRKAGIEHIIYPVDKLTGDRRFDLEHLLVPSLESLVKWKILAHELFGYLTYRIVGYA